MTFNFTTKRE